MAYLGAKPDAFQYTSTSSQSLSGNGVTTTFTLNRQVSANADIEVVVNNVPQEPGFAYYVSDLTNLNFTSPPSAAANNIYVVYRAYVQSGIAPGANTVTTSAIAANTIQPWQLTNSLLNPIVNTFTANGTGTTYTLSFAPPSANAVVVTVNGITQNHPANYSTNNTVLTFTNPPAATSVIRVLQQAMIGTSIVPIDGSVTTSKLGQINTINGGGASLNLQTNATNRLTIDTSGNVGIGTSSPTANLSFSDFAGTAGTPNKITLFSNTYGFGISSSQLNYVSNGSHVFYDATGERLRLTASAITANANSITIPAIDTQTRSIEIGSGRTGNGYAYVDLIGDATYPDYGFRMLRGNTGANTNSALIHRGTGDLQIQTTDAALIQFTTTNTERMRIPSAGGVQVVTCLSVGNTTPSSSGAGITFPATQSASSDANTLDDYEEGTWTPNAFNNGSSSTWTVKIGRYTKVGNLVTCWFNCDGGTSGTAGGAILLTGLPFADIGNGNWQVLGMVTTNAYPAAPVMMQSTGGSTTQIWTNGVAQDTAQRTYISGMFTYRS